ncbi:MAG TPA: hypothetical protein VFA84_05325 [Acidimicrobiales bacterium]|nr:hypothetical protein [Acidimicrobiales bacterium]
MTAVPDYLFTDVRRFAAPPGRPYGSERVERRPRRVHLGALVRRWLDRYLAGRLAGDAEAPELPSYFPAPDPVPAGLRRRGA